MNKKFLSMSVAMMILIGIFFVAAAIAGQVYDRTTVSVGTTGVGMWTNDLDYSAVKLNRLFVERGRWAPLTTNTVTFTRRTKADSVGGSYTQALGAVSAIQNASTNSANGVQATLTGGYLMRGDIVYFAADTLTNYIIGLEYEVQQH